MATEGNTIPSGKNLAGAAAEVSIIVAKTVGSINDYAQTAASATVKMMNSALRSGFMGSLAGMFGGLVQAGGDAFSAAAGFRQGTKKFKQAKELGALDKATGAAIAPLKAGQETDFANLKKHPKPIANGKVLSNEKMADDRSSLDTHNTQIKSLNTTAEGKRGVIEAKGSANDFTMQSFQTLGRVLGTIGNAFGMMSKETNKGIADALQNGAAGTQKAIDGLHSTASQLSSMASQLYVANTMVRG